MVGHPVSSGSGVEVGELLLGKYRIVQPIKTGGTAAIYLAIMHGENLFTREVVIKRPLPHLLADPRMRDMFIDEAHVQSRLAHPNIVQVLDLIAQGNEVFLVLEFLNGVDLREIHSRCADRGHAVPQQLAAYISAEVCAGLHFAHEVTAPDGKKLNLVHRDVSPKNIRITDRGAVKLIDFGIAHFDNRLTETKEGSIKGTLGFMSPEQIMGEEVDRRVDVFAFGICMFQMLTGRNPFHASNLKERIHKLIHAPVPRVSESNPAIDAALDAIVARCLDRDLDTRYQTAEAVQRDLAAYIASAQIVSPREQLTGFLEDLFPDIHEPPSRLKAALTETSGLGRRSTVGVGSEAMTQAPPEPEAPLSEELRIAPSAAAHRTVPNVPIGSEHQTAALSGPPTKRAGASMTAIAAAAVVVVLLGGAVLWTMIRPPATAVESLGAVATEVATVVVDAGVAAVAPPPPATPKQPTTTRTPSKHRPRQQASGSRDPATARRYLKTGVHLFGAGENDAALLMYTLAYAASGSRPGAALFKNLGLTHKALGNSEKLRACFNMYLAKKPSASDAERIRSLLAAQPASANVTCVSRSDIARAKKMSGRMGARIESWMTSAGVGS